MTKKTSPAYRASKEETIPINRLHPFSNHPFHIRHDLEFSELVDSISESGIITPIIVRPKVGVGYEVISGHRRWEACKELGIESIPARVEYIDDDEATILMVNSNIQREHVLPSEKAFAYKMRMEALKHQGRTTLAQVGPKFSSEKIAAETGDSRNQVKRYIRLTYLIPSIPKEEVQFIHDADTETKKAELFGKVRNGTVRVLMGSTQKMGAGTNVQTRLIALHHLDCPWRPADIAQRNGRMVRQGNLNKEVSIFIYVTESTFDSYSWQLVENKQKFISQIMTSKSPARSCEDLDEAALTYAEVKALAAGNPMIKEKMDLDIQVARLRTLKAAYTSQHYRLEDAIAVAFPRQIKGTEHRIRAFEQDIQTAKEHQSYDVDKKLIFSIELDGKTYDKREDAGKALLGLVGAAVRATKPVPVGYYAGFEITVEYKPLEKVFHAHLVGEATHTTELGNDAAGNMIRFQNVVSALPQDLNRLHGSLEQLTKQLTNAEEELKQPFLQEQELSDKSARLAELDALLNVGNDAPIIEGEAEELEEEPEDALIQSDDELER